MIRSLSIENRPSELEKVSSWIRRVSASHGLQEKEIFALDLVSEEAVTNIIRHAFSEGGNAQIEIRFEIDADTVTLRIEDSGRAFDPREAPEPVPSKDIATMKVGGLGIHLIRKLMDGMDYTREGERNVLTLWKKINRKGVDT